MLRPGPQVQPTRTAAPQTVAATAQPQTMAATSAPAQPPAQGPGGPMQLPTALQGVSLNAPAAQPATPAVPGAQPATPATPAQPSPGQVNDIAKALQGNGGMGSERRQAMHDWRDLRPQFTPGMDRQDFRTQMQDWRSQRPGMAGFFDRWRGGTEAAANPTPAVPGNTGIVPPNMQPPQSRVPQFGGLAGAFQNIGRQMAAKQQVPLNMTDRTRG